MIDLVGPDEIAKRLGVAPNTVAHWRKRDLLPEPFAVVSRVPMWHWQVIRAWADASGRLDGRRAVPAVSRDDVIAARAQVLREADKLADEATGILDSYGVSVIMHRPPERMKIRRIDGRFTSLDGRGFGGGEWDWLAGLSDVDRAWLYRSHFTTGASALRPDQFAQLMHRDVDDAMAEWVRCLRVTDAASALRGRITWRRSSHLFTGLSFSYDVGELFGSYAQATEYLASLDVIDDEQEPTELVASLGPSPCEMDYEPWAAELTELWAKAERIVQTTGEWDIVPAEDQAVYDRIEELLPASVAGVGGTLEDLYVASVGAYLAHLAA